MRKKYCSLIFLVCYLAYTSIYIARLNLSMASPEMIASGIADEAQIGMLGSVFSVIYACGRLINGNQGDKRAPWIMISGGLLLCAAANFAISFFPPFYAILLLWGLNAFAQSMLWSSVLCIVSDIYGTQKAKKMTSYMVTSVAVGNILGILFNTWFIQQFGLRYAFFIPAILAFIFCGLIFVFTGKIRPLAAGDRAHQPMHQLFLQKKVRISILPALFHGMMKDNISLWMTVYFVDRYCIDLKASAGFVLFIPLIGFVGRMLYPFFYKICREWEHLVSVYGFVACAICALPLCSGILPPAVAAVCLSLIYAAVSCINTSMLSIFPLQFAESGNVASMSGIMDFATYFGAGIASFAYGFLIKHYGYFPMFASWVLISVVSVVLMKPLLRK